MSTRATMPASVNTLNTKAQGGLPGRGPSRRPTPDEGGVMGAFFFWTIRPPPAVGNPSDEPPLTTLGVYQVGLLRIMVASPTDIEA